MDASSPMKMKPFVVVRFYPTDKDPTEYMEVSLSSWLIGSLDDNMDGYTRWPPNTKQISELVKNEVAPDSKWEQFKVQVMRFFDTFSAARAAAPKFLLDSNYETDHQELPLKRRRIRTQRFLESSSDDELPLKKSTVAIKAPPPIKAKLPERPTRMQEKNQEDLNKKKERQAVMESLKKAREIAANKTISPSKVGAWNVTPQKADVLALNQQSPQNLREESRLLKSTPQLASPSPRRPLSQCGTPSWLGSEQGSPHGSMEGAIPSDFLEQNMHTEEEDNDLVTPLASPYKPPPQRSVPRLSRSNAFCLSPRSAQEYTRDILARVEKKRREREESNEDAHIVNQNKVCSNEKRGSVLLDGKEDEGSAKRLNGRRALFLSQNENQDATFAPLEVRLKRIEENQQEASAKLDLLLMNVGRLQRSLLPSEKRIVMPHNMPNIPLGSKEALKTFENFLKDSDTNLSAVCDYMSSYVRVSVPDPERKSAHSILSKLLYNDLAKEMNLEGGNQKIGFRSLQLYKVFQGTLKNAFPDSDLATAEDALQKWLKDAKWRKNKRSSPKKTCQRSPSRKQSSNSARYHKSSSHHSRDSSRVQSRGGSSRAQSMGRSPKKTCQRSPSRKQSSNSARYHKSSSHHSRDSSRVQSRGGSSRAQSMGRSFGSLSHSNTTPAA